VQYQVLHQAPGEQTASASHCPHHHHSLILQRQRLLMTLMMQQELQPLHLWYLYQC
jgi:hypothetical protein